MPYNQSTIPISANYLFEEGNIILLVSNGDYEFVVQLENALRNVANSAGYSLQVLDAQNYNRLQLAQINGARERGEKAILLILVEPDAADRTLQAAGNMKVVLINNPPADFNLLNENVGPRQGKFAIWGLRAVN